MTDLLDLHSKHVCYVMFYDSRDAANAVSTLRHNFYIGDANIEIVESRHRPDAFNRNPLKADFQATVLVSLVDANRGFEASDRAHFERFGEVCRFYPYFSSETEWVVEYYDYRSANDAAMSCHGQPACKGTMYTTFLWDDSVPCLEMGSALNSRVRRVEASSDTRADSARAFDKAAQRSGAAPVPAREPHQGEDPGRARERAQLPNLQVYPPVLPLASRSASIAQPASAPIPSSLAAMPLPGAKKRPSAATWMDSAISNTSSRSGSIDAARSSGNSQAKQEPPGVGREPAATAASMIDSVISRFAQDPGVMEKAKAAREILQQHKGLLGLSLPATAKATGAPSMLKPPLPPMSAPAPGPVVAAMTGASAVSALNQLVNRAPRYDSQSTIVADISPLIPSKDIDNTLSGLLGSPPSVFDLAKSANAAANAVHSAIATTVSMDNVSSEFMDMNVATNSSSTTATAVGTSAMLTLPKQGFGAPTSVSNHDEGINHLLGILAQVQRSSAAAAEVPKKF
ncbi:hypothetical protein GGI20_001596 [Coemansia sp. BCRC 34301]|nr:hypothetical protein GGI20_001596 [Coemansia sp. BCRC 34301]